MLQRLGAGLGQSRVKAALKRSLHPRGLETSLGLPVGQHTREDQVDHVDDVLPFSQKRSCVTRTGSEGETLPDTMAGGWEGVRMRTALVLR